MLRLDRARITSFIDDAAQARARERAVAAHRTVVEGTGVGSEMLGWRSLLLEPDGELLPRILEVAEEIRREADVLLCIGIGGSYLGAKAVMEALGPYFGAPAGPEILFAGHNLSGAYHRDLMAHLDGKRVYVNVISKSGTTLEPAVAFRLARDFLASAGSDASRHVIATTDARRGVLHDLALREGYRTFEVPDDVGGRFSVLTPVGLLPLAAAGLDVRGLLDGATAVAREVDESHPALAYAADRYALHEAGYSTEILAVFEPRLRGVGEWWQQLFGESEGKAGRGLFPSVVTYTTDLHSLGQYVQEGRRNLVETFLLVDELEQAPAIARQAGNADGLDYLAGRPLAEVNRVAYEATADAHAAGGVPNSTWHLEQLDASHLGALLYTFEHAVAVSGYMLGLNPFDQPGVEAYKSRMFELLGRP